MERHQISIAKRAVEFEKSWSISERQSAQGRYKFLASLINPNDVLLDIGVDFGAGLKPIAEKASRIVGIEISSLETQISAYNARQFNNVTIVQMNGEKLAFPNESFDIVSSLECIEHVQNPTVLLAEIVRVLRPGGIAVISTPNKDITGSKFLNEHHLREWSMNEFQKLLSNYFSNVDLYGQRITTGKASQKLFTVIRSSFTYEIYRIMPKKAKSFMSNTFQNATLGDSWNVKPINVIAGEKPLTIIAVCKK